MKFRTDDPVAVSTLRRWREALSPEAASHVAGLEGSPELNVVASAVARALAEYFERHYIDDATSLNLTRPYGHTLLRFLVAKHLVLEAEPLAALAESALAGRVAVRVLLPVAGPLELQP